MRGDEPKSYGLIQLVARAFSRTRFPILTVGLTYAVSVAVGIGMVHAGNSFALNTRDQIVSGAQSGPTLTALDQNNRLVAGVLDFSGNLLAAVSSTPRDWGLSSRIPS
ncbi:MAG: hypothetical protein ABSA10_10715 [Anaerolineales bacterium]|jgi:hypothetical protein